MIVHFAFICRYSRTTEKTCFRILKYLLNMVSTALHGRMHVDGMGGMGWEVHAAAKAPYANRCM